jgi:Flp pilus assembly protein TadD
MPSPVRATQILAELRYAIGRDPDAAMRAGLMAMRLHHEEAALPLLREATARHRRHAGLAQITGLAARNLCDLDTAVRALTQASALAPDNALIAHGLARSRLEAGLPAIDDFQRALRLTRTDGSVILGALRRTGRRGGD